MGKLSRKEKISSIEMRFSVLPFCLKMKDQVDEDLAAEVLGGLDEETLPFISDLQQFNRCDITEALKCVKKISAHISNEKKAFPDVLLRALVYYFVIVETKTPLKRAIASNLDGIKRDDAARKIQNALCVLLGQLFREVQSHSCIYTGRHIIDLIKCSAEFSFGRKFVQAEFTVVLIFLHWFMETILSAEREANTDKNYENDICAMLKCAVSIFKKCLNAENRKYADHELIGKILVLSKGVIVREHLGWDCHNAAGMNWIAIWKISYGHNEFLLKIATSLADLKHNLYKHDNTASAANNDVEPALISKGLGFCNGVMVILNVAELVQEIGQEDSQPKCIVLHYLLPYLKTIDKLCKTILHQVIITKCFAKWTALVFESMKMDIPNIVKDFLIGDSGDNGVITDLTSYAFTKLEHPTDAIRHQANEMLMNLLGISVNLGIQDFTHILLKNIMSQNWEKRSTFTALNCILPHISLEDVFHSYPNITVRLLEAMKHQSLAPYASATYQIIVSKLNDLNKNPTGDADDGNELFTLLIEPMVTLMCKCNAHSLRLLIDYCFVKVLKWCGNNCLDYIFSTFHSKLSSFTNEDYVAERVQILSGFLSCVKMATSKGHAKDDDVIVFLEKYPDLIETSLVHEDNEIRHLGFALLCEAVKPSSFVPIDTLKKLRHALPFNVSCQDPAFRQKLTTSLKKLLMQVRRNMASLEKIRDKTNDSCEGTTFHAYQNFIHWLGKYVSSQLHPSAPYPKRVTCINTLTLVIEIFIDFKNAFTVDFSTVFTSSTVQSLFVLLSDPYEEIKQMSFTLLKNLNLRGYVKNFMSEEWLDTMLAKSLDRACCCPKPECCSDAAYHIKLYCALSENRSSELSVTMGLCEELLKLLNNSVDFAGKNLYLAATSSPMYGLLHCLKSLFQTVKFREVENILQWRHLVSSTIDLCFRVSNVVLPVVGCVSPEGHLPEIEQVTDEEVTGGLDDAWNDLSNALKSLIVGNNDKDEEDERKTRALAQQILICCWRSAKESSLLLQELTSDRLPLDSSKDSHDGVLSWNQLLSVGEHLLKQLMDARHRGAFEIAYYAFKAYCPRLWSLEHQELRSVPKRWLESSLSDLKDPNRSKDLCATRRSAGLPFLMQALLSANRNAEGRKQLHMVLVTLLRLCEIQDINGIIAKVHALNILRGLVKDATLGEEILPYVSECMQVSLTGFSSALWSIRNSSTLLFSALFTRIFGVKREKNDDFSSKNRLSGNEFFSRLPGLHPFLVKHLRMICKNLDKGGHHALCPALHPILLLLSHIFSSTMKSTAGIGLEDFIPLLIQCRASAVYKSRVANAAALASILPWEQHLPVVRKCCHNLVEDVSILRGHLIQQIEINSSPQNRVHGGLLQISEIIRNCATKDQSHGHIVSEVFSTVCQTLLQVIPYLSSRKNNCPLTRSASMEIFFQAHEITCIEGCIDEGWQKMVEDVTTACSAELHNTEPGSPGYSFLIHTCAKVWVLLPKKSASDLSLDGFLSTKSSDSLAALLKVLSDRWVAIARQLSSDDRKTLESRLVNIVMQDFQTSQIATLIYTVLSKITSRQTVISLFQDALETAKTCNAAQSLLLEALLKFQSTCIVLVVNKNLPVSACLLDCWIDVLSSASRCYENTDNVRLAVANSLLDNSSLLINHEELLGERVVRLWRILMDLLCDEGAEIRKVACYATFQAARKSGVRCAETDHPCVDNLALIQAIVTLVLTHGKKYGKSCRSALQNLSRSESTIVPINTTEGSDEDVFPGLFERSEVNTYLDAPELARIASIGLDILEDIGGSLELDFLTLIKKFK